MSTKRNETEAMKYVKSLKDVVKRQYAQKYLDWLIAGRMGDMPSRGALPPVLAKAVCQNLDGLV